MPAAVSGGSGASLRRRRRGNPVAAQGGGQEVWRRGGVGERRPSGFALQEIGAGGAGAD